MCTEIELIGKNYESWLSCYKMSLMYLYFNNRSRQLRVFFTEGNETPNRSMKIRRNGGVRKNYVEDSEDKPIQQSKL